MRLLYDGYNRIFTLIDRDLSLEDGKVYTVLVLNDMLPPSSSQDPTPSMDQ